MTAARLSVLLLALFVPVALLSLLVGEVPAAALLRDPDLARMLFTELRLPRLILAAAAGAALGISGAALQGLLRNPLASPDILGTSAGAALGAVVTGYFLGFSGTIAMAGGGIAGALLALVLLLLLAGRGASSTTLILAGVAISALGGAMMNLALALAASPFAFYDMMFWLLGSFADRSIEHVGVGLPAMLIGSTLVFSASRGLDALALGEDVAATLGHDVRPMRWRIVGGSAIAVGGAVAVAGIIGFVGLIVPHLVRPLVRN
ncbi:MAG: iron chelate uptake ABC transporter family permease subunit, partial [Sphingomonadaceae bacterium]|nr:iron chelate uptake ABC transporter family permease subunit [Sphingomonadaceae bacterium]